MLDSPEGIFSSWLGRQNWIHGEADLTGLCTGLARAGQGLFQDDPGVSKKRFFEGKDGFRCV